MGEIKSTVELAMERTKRFRISDEEKREMKQKERTQKASSLFNRFMEGYLNVNEILKEIERMDQPSAKTVKDSFFSQLVNALSLRGGAERLIEGLEALKPQPSDLDKIRQELFHLLSQHQKEKERLEWEAKAQAAEALRMAGIYGSAVEPNMEGTDYLKSGFEDLRARSEARLEEIKRQLRALKIGI